MSAIIIINLFISLGCFLALLLLFSCCLLLSGDYKGLGENNTAVEQDDSSRE